MFSLDKPVKGTFRLELLEKRRARRNAEAAAKEAVRRRDKRQCRVPGCTFLNQGWGLHVAHLSDKSLGGNSDTSNLLCLCMQHHEGPVSVHSKHLRIMPDTARGADGICTFWLSDEQEKWISLGVS